MRAPTLPANEMLSHLRKGRETYASHAWHDAERTIERHLSNILDKLDVPSWAAATAYACDHKLI